MQVALGPGNGLNAHTDRWSHWTLCEGGGRKVRLPRRLGEPNEFADAPVLSGEAARIRREEWRRLIGWVLATALEEPAL